jgi:sulfur-oxidizing protein SoxY
VGQYLVALGAGGALLPVRSIAQSRSSTDIVSLQEQQTLLKRELLRALGDIELIEGRVNIQVPSLADNGNSVPCTILVDSPMTPEDHVRELHMFAAINPRPFVLKAYFSAANPQARLDTRLRLAGSQRLLAVAIMSNGRAFSGTADVQVSVSACVDGS